MDKAAAEQAYTPAAVAALAEFAVGPTELELVWHSENVTFRVTDRNDGAR